MSSAADFPNWHFTETPLPFPPAGDSWDSLTLDQLHQDLAVVQQNKQDMADSIDPHDVIGRVNRFTGQVVGPVRPVDLLTIQDQHSNYRILLAQKFFAQAAGIGYAIRAKTK